MDAWLPVLAGMLVALNGATFVYVVRIEKRLTRLETIEELRERIVITAHAPGGAVASSAV